MSKDLTNSAVDRQNILNNPYTLAEIEKAAGIRGIPFEGKTVVLKDQVASFFEVTVRTVENYLEQNAEELARNGYEVLKGKRLRELKLGIQGMDVPETDFGNIAKTPQLGILDFRTFLNLAMLMRESERAGLLRKAILDIVIDTINRSTGGGTKYINQRDEDFIQSAFIEENYRQQFTDALKDCVDMGNFKYADYTDKNSGISLLPIATHGEIGSQTFRLKTEAVTFRGATIRTSRSNGCSKPLPRMSSECCSRWRLERARRSSRFNSPGSCFKVAGT